MGKALIHAHDETLTSQKFQKQSWTFSNNSTCLYICLIVWLYTGLRYSLSKKSIQSFTCVTFSGKEDSQQSFISLQTKYMKTLIPQWIFHLAQGLPTGHVTQKSQQREQH